MNIEERDIILLSDNNNYLVAKKINYNNVFYYCVIDVNNDENIKYLYEQDNELIEVEDEKTFENVLIQMAENSDISKLLDMLKSKIEHN